jgi:hypothetical protein
LHCLCGAEPRLLRLRILLKSLRGHRPDIVIPGIPVTRKRKKRPSMPHGRSLSTMSQFPNLRQSNSPAQRSAGLTLFADTSLQPELSEFNQTLATRNATSAIQAVTTPTAEVSECFDMFCPAPELKWHSVSSRTSWVHQGPILATSTHIQNEDVAIPARDTGPSFLTCSAAHRRAWTRIPGADEGARRRARVGPEKVFDKGQT